MIRVYSPLYLFCFTGLHLTPAWNAPLAFNSDIQKTIPATADADSHMR
jgi:hypothetical protein